MTMKKQEKLVGFWYTKQYKYADNITTIIIIIGLL
jgi:hypothetical protein